jgi:hypothetical protein
MQAVDTIDFTRGDMGGVWLVFVCVTLGTMLRTRKADLVGGGFRKAARHLLGALLIGALGATPIVLAVEIWVRRPSYQYYVRLRLEEDRVVLGYRWPNEDLTIPIRRISAVSIIYQRSIDGRTRRAQIEVLGERLHSFGFGRKFTPEEQAVWDRLAALVDEAHRSPP